MEGVKDKKLANAMATELPNLPACATPSPLHCTGALSVYILVVSLIRWSEAPGQAFGSSVPASFVLLCFLASTCYRLATNLHLSLSVITFRHPTQPFLGREYVYPCVLHTLISSPGSGKSPTIRQALRDH